jgi:toxin-antitoxin system PIN domain toxin
MLLDANLLIYAIDRGQPAHGRAATWLGDQLSGAQRVGVPWESLTAFLRIVTNPRITSRPLRPSDAWRVIEDWLDSPVVWTPLPTERHATVLGELVRKYRLGGNLVPDGQIAALAIQHGLEICSADTDFARFSEVRWRNPLVE